jgi:hypothetical protein
MDYSKIQADPVRGPEIGRLYMESSGFITTLTRIAYRQFIDQVWDQFNALPVKVHFQEADPYECAEQMFADVSAGHLRVYMTDPETQKHPLLPDHANNAFRAVHDYHGHYMTGRGFDRHGEEAAWVRHSAMFTGLGRRAMTTETRGQSSALCWLLKGTDRFPPQKAVLLPDWVSEIPCQWK